MPSPLGKVAFSTFSMNVEKDGRGLPQYEFAERYQQNDNRYRTSPAPCGGTLPTGEG